MVIYYIGHVYLRPYVYSFCQIFQALRLFPALRLLRTLEYVLYCVVHIFNQSRQERAPPFEMSKPIKMSKKRFF